MPAICGLDCTKCHTAGTCAGCAETGGHPFGGECVLAMCCRGKRLTRCDECAEKCAEKSALIDEFNALGIPDMPRITELYALSASFVNLEYALPGGQSAKFWDDKDVLLGTQLPKGDTGRFYGVVSDGGYLMVSEYGENGAEPEILIFRKRKAE